MKTNLIDIYLMPKGTFDQFFENIEHLSDLFFRELKQPKYKNTVELKNEIFFHIDSIEKDVYNRHVKAYKAGTFDNYLHKFHEYARNIEYEIQYTLNETKFKYYYKKFKSEAYQLKDDTSSFMLESYEYSQHLLTEKRSLPKPPKRSTVLFMLVKEIVINNPELQNKGIWYQLLETIGTGKRFKLSDNVSESKHHIHLDNRFKSKIMDGKFIDKDLETGIKRTMTFSTMMGFVKAINTELLNSCTVKNISE